MVTDALTDNARDLERDLDWFAEVLTARLKLYFQPEEPTRDPLAILPPELAGDGSGYAGFVQRHRLTPAERLVMLLALIPHVRPQLLDVLWVRNDTTGRGFTEFGGLIGATHGGFLPTGETAIFLLAGEALAARFEHSRMFSGDHCFARHNIVHLAPTPGGEPALSGALVIGREILHNLTSGLEYKPGFSTDFPARLIETRLDWEDLVLPTATVEQLDEVRQWILHGETLLTDWDMAKKLAPGFTCLFHGPPGTGKTLAACLLGRHCGCEVYKIDLGMIVSKYIGETEKNLSRIFDTAENRRWILFFDEADALFGKRTRVEDAHDRYANQEVSFLLQRVETFRGVVILASNLKTNIDDAFLRRFQSVIAFPLPRPAERRRLWHNAIPRRAELAADVDLPRLAEKFELAGGTIMNVVRFASLKSLGRASNTILLADLEEGVRRELQKEGRTV